MKKLNKTLIAVAIATSLFSACSKDDAGALAIQKSDIESVDGDNSRFVSYNTIQTAEATKGETRAAESIPAAPVIPEGAVNMLDVDGKGTHYAAWKAVKGTTYYLPEGTVWSDQLQFGDGINYYVGGSLVLDFYGAKGELNILPKGALKIDSNQSLNNLTIRCWGDLDVDSSVNLVIGKGTSFVSYSDSELNVAKLQIQSEFEHRGDINVVADIDCSGFQSSFAVYGSVAASSMRICNSSKASVEGNVVTTTDVEVSGCSSLSVGASLVIEDGRLYGTNYSNIDVADYIKCNTLELDSYANVISHKETLIVCDDLLLRNNTAKIHNADTDGAYTVVVAGNIEAQSNIDRLNGGGMDLHTDPEEYENLGWTANVIFNGSTYIPEKGLRPEFGVRPVEPTPVYTLNHIGGISSLDKESVSATSIDFINNLAYFSWHKRGNKYDGYIDVANIESRTILSTLHSATQDFNSISVLGSQISAVGADAKGAIISNIVYSNSVVSADFLHIIGASANSVLNVGESKWVTTNEGITILPENKFIPLNNAKYAVAADGRVIVLARTGTSDSVSDSFLYVFEQSGELVKGFSCGVISIENGKNTIFADGGTIYVSCGVEGLRSYDLNGQLLNEFEGFKTVDEGAVNGVSVDEKFVYMACGLSGLHILDKSDFSTVKSYTLNGASANFVKKASDGLIYVAYGLNGVHILELQVQQ